MAVTFAPPGETNIRSELTSAVTDIPAAMRRLVLARAENRCEYCRLSQSGQEATFHIDHIIPVSTGGKTSAGNLALACVSCSLRKGAQQFVTDPDTDTLTTIFHPRQDDWDAHFHWEGVVLIGRTPIARATIAALALNRPVIQAIRREQSLLGRHPAVDSPLHDPNAKSREP